MRLSLCVDMQRGIVARYRDRGGRAGRVCRFIGSYSENNFFVNRNTPKNMPLLSCVKLHRVYVEASLLYAGTDPDKRRPISIICYDKPHQSQALKSNSSCDIPRALCANTRSTSHDKPAMKCATTYVVRIALQHTTPG